MPYFFAYFSMANLSHWNFTALFAFVVIPSRICTHIASVLKPAMGVACPLMCIYKSHTKKCGGSMLLIVFPFPADAPACSLGLFHLQFIIGSRFVLVGLASFLSLPGAARERGFSVT